MKILIVDDEQEIASIVRSYLEKEGYQVILASDGKSALMQVERQSPDLVILDLMLPEISGWDVCRAIRRKSNLPVIMVTARDEVADRIVGLELGADDYVNKPFDPKELVSRVKAVLRRSQPPPKTMLRVRDLTIDTEKRLLYRGDIAINGLTRSEFDLVCILAENPGRVFSRMQILNRLQGEAYEGYERTIDSHVKNLRRKIELDPEHPKYIITVHGVGYKMEET